MIGYPGTSTVFHGSCFFFGTWHLTWDSVTFHRYSTNHQRHTGARDRWLRASAPGTWPLSFPTMLSKSHPTSTRAVYRSLRATSGLNRRQTLSAHAATRIPPSSSAVSCQALIPGPNFSGVSRHFATTSEQHLFCASRSLRGLMCIL